MILIYLRLLVITLSFVTFQAATLWAFKPQVGIIASSALDFHSAPNTSAPVFAILSKGTHVKILENIDGWIKIAFQEKIGYVAAGKGQVDISASGSPIALRNASRGEEVDRIKKQVRSIDNAIDDHSADMKKYIRKESKIVYDLTHINRKLNSKQIELTGLQKELSLLKEEIKTGKEVLNGLKKKISMTEDYASNRLASLYKLNCMGKYLILAGSDSIYSFLAHKTNLERIIASDEKVLETFMTNKARFSVQLGIQKEQQLKLEQLKATIENRMEEMAAEKKLRSGLLARVRNEKKTKIQTIVTLKQVAKSLEMRILKITSPPIIAEKSLPSRMSFHKLKGLLKIPANGRITDRFGLYKDTKFNLEYFRNGINIKAERGEPVISVYSGEVVFSGWLSGYGNMIIVSHNDNYHTVYAHIEELFKSKGNKVDTGEVIATVGETNTLTGSGLYFEIRHKGKPVNPVEWIQSG